VGPGAFWWVLMGYGGFLWCPARSGEF
jgi:hypothetical protein